MHGQGYVKTAWYRTGDIELHLGGGDESVTAGTQAAIALAAEEAMSCSAWQPAGADAAMDELGKVCFCSHALASRGPWYCIL
jgi:hypothetical protein